MEPALKGMSLDCLHRPRTSAKNCHSFSCRGRVGGAPNTQEPRRMWAVGSAHTTPPALDRVRNGLVLRYSQNTAPTNGVVLQPLEETVHTTRVTQRTPQYATTTAHRVPT